MCSINLNDPLPTIEYRSELFDIIKMPEYKLPKKGEIVTLINLDHEMVVKAPHGDIIVKIGYINGTVIFTIPCKTRPCTFVYMPSIERFCFYDILNNKPIGGLYEEQEAMQRVVMILKRIGKTPGPKLLERAGMYVPGSKVPPKVPQLPVRTSATRTISKTPKITVTIKSKPIITNLHEITRN